MDASSFMLLELPSELVEMVFHHAIRMDDASARSLFKCCKQLWTSEQLVQRIGKKIVDVSSSDGECAGVTSLVHIHGESTMY